MARYRLVNGQLVKDDEEQQKKGNRYKLQDDGTIKLLENETMQSSAQQAEREQAKWFSSGAFGDDEGGFWSDLFDTVTGSVADVALNIGKGIGSVVEGVVDLGMYGASGIADLIGADDVAGTLKRTATRNALDRVTDPIEEFLNLDNNSVFGEMPDNIAKGVGQVATLIATGGAAAAGGAGTLGATAATSALTYASSMGSGMSEAYQYGATDEDALKYGAIKGAADTVTELIFGGMGKGLNAVGLGKGLSSADDVLAKTLSSKVSSSLAKNLINVGVKSSAEGLEEVLAGFVTAVAKKNTYMEEEDWDKILADEKLLDQFVVGALTSGIVQGPNARSATKSGRDMITGFTSNEQAVVDYETSKRIEAKEKNGKELSGKEKTAIAKQVEKDVKRGYISIDSIETALGGDTYQSLKDITEKEAKLIQEIETLENIEAAKITVKQTERLAEARKELEELKGKDEKSTIQSRLSKEVSDMTTNDAYLRESYNEKARKREAYTEDISKYSEKEKATIQRAIDSGVLNNTNKVHDFVDMIAKISAEKGIEFDFINNQKLKESGLAIEGRVVNGYTQGSNITLNMESAKAYNALVGHEIVHVLDGTESFAVLRDMVKDYAESKGEYQKRYDAIQELYKDVKDVNIENEVTADLIGNYLFSDKNFINNLSTEQPGLFKRIFEEIKYFIKKITPGSKEAKQLDEIKRMFEKVYREDVQVADNGEVKYSISKMKNGEKYVQIDVDLELFEGLNESQSKEMAKEVILERFTGKVIGSKEDNPIVATKRTAKEYGYAEKRSLKGEMITDKMKASTELDNLLEASEYIDHATYEDVKEKHPEAVGGIDYYETTFKVGNNWYTGIINVINSKNVRFLYDLTKIRSITKNEFPVKNTSPASNASNYSVPQKQNNASKNSSKSLSSAIEALEELYGPYSITREDALIEIGDTDIDSLEDLPIRSDISPLATSQDNDIPDDLPIRSDIGNNRDLEPNPDVFDRDIKTVQDVIDSKIETLKVELQSKHKRKEESYRQYNNDIAKKMKKLESMKNQETKAANKLKDQIEKLKTARDITQAEFDKSISDIEKRIEDMSKPDYKTAMQRKVKSAEHRTLMSNLMGDTSNWKDKKTGWGFNSNTFKRNLRYVIPDKEVADAIYRETMGKYNHHEAQLKIEANEMSKKYFDMNINKYEDQYIQMLGEYKYNPDTTITEEQLQKFYNKHKKRIDVAKVDNAIEEARKDYDELFARVNEVLREQGMKELDYREGYFPHFTKQPQGLLAKLLNWKKEDNSIPTDIAGLTEEFKPNKSYQSFAQRRHSDTTDYSFTTGFDMYLQGALDWIYHIDDIQKLRAFENEIRYRHSDARVQETIKQIEANESMDADEVQALIDGVYAEKNNPLNNFVQNLRTHTNLLAGKKNTMDRAMEQNFNRNIYSVVKNGSSRISANMVAGSISSALTNFIPITQSWGEVSPISTLRAMKETIQAAMIDDGVVAKSDFLTNRLNQVEKLGKTKWDKVADKLMIPMSAIDSFSSQTVWRSKYNENIKAGMSEKEAIQNADEFAEGLIAGRSRGNMPVIFELKNPLLKIITVFQLETANQYHYFFKDLPQDMKDKTIAKLTKAYCSIFIGAHVYNAFYSSLTGRDAALDPISIVMEFLADLFGGDDEEEGGVLPATFNLAKNVGEELPYIGGLVFGGGRIPVSSAMPYDDGLLGVFENTYKDIQDENYERLTSEWLNPVYYLAFPAGGGQLKKTMEGLAMFDDDLPVPGSYTDSGNLRFSVDDTLGNKVQAALFGQWSSDNAQDYIDNGRQSLKKNQIEEYASLYETGMTMQEYWDYREGLKEKNTIDEKYDYIASLDATTEQKNIMINNIVNRKNPFEEYEELYEETDMTMQEYWDYREGLEEKDTLEEMLDYIDSLDVTTKQKDIMTKNVTDREKKVDLSTYDDYSSYEEFDYAIKYPEKYEVSKAIGNFATYSSYTEAIKDIEPDKDKNGKSVNGSRKEKIIEYINDLDADYGEKIILFKMYYKADNTYNMDIVEYLNSRDDISYTQMETILKELDFEVLPDGTVRWD